MFFKSSEIYNFIEKETPTQVFSREFCEIFQNTDLVEHIRTATYDEFLILKLSEKHFKNAATCNIKTWSSIFISTEHLKWFTLKKPTQWKKWRVNICLCMVRHFMLSAIDIRWELYIPQKKILWGLSKLPAWYPVRKMALKFPKVTLKFF